MGGDKDTNGRRIGRENTERFQVDRVVSSELRIDLPLHTLDNEADNITRRMLRRLVVPAVVSLAVAWASGSAAAQGPTVAQIEAAIATHSNDFILVNAYAHDGAAPGHGWIDVKTGAGRWVSADGKLVTLHSVAADPHDRALVVLTQTEIDFATRTWSRTKVEQPAKKVIPQIVDPLDAASAGVHFRLVSVERVDGRQSYHLRSTTYFQPVAGDNVFARLDVWFSTDQDYLIRYTTTTRAGKVISNIDNHWLPRTVANLALLTTTVPSGFRHVSRSS